MTTDRPIVVVKVGGSLLDWPPLPDRLARFVAARGDDRVVLVVGGGRFADALRDLDHAVGLGEPRSHALALRVLDLSAHTLAALVPGTVVVEEAEDLPAEWAVGMVPILAPRRLLDRDDQDAVDPLPHRWDVTTDSIAARVAERLGAAELVLLKSAPIPARVSLIEAAGVGLVDPYFPTIARGLERVTLMDLRELPSSGAIASFGARS